MDRINKDEVQNRLDRKVYSVNGCYDKIGRGYEIYPCSDYVIRVVKADSIWTAYLTRMDDRQKILRVRQGSTRKIAVKAMMKSMVSKRQEPAPGIDALKAEKAKLEQAWKDAAKAAKAVEEKLCERHTVTRNAMNLLPDVVKFDSEYVEARGAYNAAFRAMRNFNLKYATMLRNA